MPGIGIVLGTITKRDLRRHPQLRAAVDAEIARRGRAQPQRDRRRALVGKTSGTQGLVDLVGPLLIRITRGYVEEEYDDDNFSGGCKQLRDAIAAAFSRAGDSAQDGLFWEYRQIQSEAPEIIIEIFEKKDAF